jgi:hypothetical protein
MKETDKRTLPETPDQWRFGRYKAAYLEMAKQTKYRPGAPS